MKYLVIVAEGISDFPSKKFNDKTPLELARTPNLDKLALNGECGMLKATSSSFFPGSDIGFLSILGLNPSKVNGGRGYFEAKGLGIEVLDDEITFRVNLITIENERMISYGAPTISDDECIVISTSLNEAFKDLPIQFYPVSGYRLVMKAKKDWLFDGKKNNLKIKNPRNDLNFYLKDNYPKGNGSKKIISILEKAKEVLEHHDINHVKIDLGESPANGLWIWGGEVPKKIQSFYDLYSLKGFCVPGTHLTRGIALSLGLEASPPFEPHGEGFKVLPKRVEDFIKAIDIFDVSIMHIETINDLSKVGDLHKKCQCIEGFDEKVIGSILKYLEEKQYEYRILVTSSHPLGIDTGIPVRGAVPWVLSGKGIKPDKTKMFSEKEADTSRFSFITGYKFFKKMLFLSSR